MEVRYHRPGRRKKPGNLKWLMYILSVLLIWLTIFFFMQSSFFVVSSIKVNGLNSFSPEEIIELGGLVKGTNIFQVDISQAEEKIKTNSIIKEVIVKRKLPQTLVINVQERTPLVLIPVEGGFLQVDSQGYILKKQNELGRNPIPIITGIELPGTLSTGKLLKSDKLQLALKIVSQMDTGSKDIVAEIEVKDSQNIKAFTVQGIEVRLGDSEEFPDKFKKFLIVLNQEKKHNNLNKIEYIDVSFAGKPVILYKN
jgi:cell division protein FtsQ